MAKQDIGDLELIRQKLERWMCEKLGGLDDFVLGELNFPEASGESSVTLIVQASWSESGSKCAKKFVIRMAPAESQVFEEHDLYLQYRLMEVMAEEGVPAPKLMGYEPSSDLVGSDFYIMEFIDGQIPPDNPPMAFGSWVSELTADQRKTMWGNGLKTLAKIHSIDMTKYDVPGLPRSADNEPSIAHELRKFDGIIVQGMRDNADPMILQAWQFLKENVPSTGDRGLCWGDSRPGNVIWGDLAPIAIIDWEMASIGDRQMDLAWWFWVDHCNAVGLGAEKLTGIPEFSDAYQQWHEITGLSIDNIAYYELFCVVRFAIVMERKLVFMTQQDPNYGEMVSHPVQFIEPLMDICKAQLVT